MIYANLMGITGDSYLPGVYLVKIATADSQGNAAFQPKKHKNEDTEKILAYFRFLPLRHDRA